MNRFTYYISSVLAVILLFTGESFAQWKRSEGPYGGTIYSLKGHGSTLLAATLDGVFFSSDSGNHWASANAGLEGLHVLTFAAIGGDLFAGTSGKGVYISSNNGTSWAPVNSGMINNNINANSLVVNGNNLFAGTSDGVYLSTDKGTLWTPVNAGLKETTVESLVGSGSHLFAGFQTGSAFTFTSNDLYYSSDNGSSWTIVDTDIYRGTGIALLAIGDTLLASGSGNVSIYTKNGSNWTKINTPMNIGGSITSFQVKGTDIFAGTNGAGIYCSTDHGVSWTSKNNGLRSKLIWSLTTSDTNLFAGGDGIFHSTNDGTDWSELITGFSYLDTYSLAKNGNNLYAGTNKGIYISTNDGSRWNKMELEMGDPYVYSIAIKDSNIYAGSFPGQIFISTDIGGTWSRHFFYSNDFDTRIVKTIISDETYLYTGTNNAVFRSDDNGDTWTRLYYGLPNLNVLSLALKENVLFAGLQDNGCYVLKDNDPNWKESNSGLLSFPVSVNALIIKDGSLYAGTSYRSGIFRSVDNGLTWLPVNTDLVSKTGLLPDNIASLAIQGTYIFAASSDGYVFMTDNDGANWKEVASSMIQGNINSLAITDNILFVGTSNPGAVWYRAISEMVTNIKNEPDRSPITFELQQNYPNPFNPFTTIKFTIALRSFVTLRIVDILGRDVATIVSEELSSGNYSRQWDARKYSSGIYYYRLQSGLMTETKKMILLK